MNWPSLEVLLQRAMTANHQHTNSHHFSSTTEWAVASHAARNPLARGTECYQETSGKTPITAEDAVACRFSSQSRFSNCNH